MAYSEEPLLNSPIRWGQRLIETRDIDPIYDMLVLARLAETITYFSMQRWLLAYWCFYSAATASVIASSDDFWMTMALAAENKDGPVNGRWPRSPERRHFRGRAAIKAVRVMTLLERSPTWVIEQMFVDCDLLAVRKAAEKLPLFGPWISFKVADMGERVLGHPIVFPRDVAFYDSPRAGLVELAARNDYTADDALEYLLRSIADCRPPGIPNRPCGVQEAETILCKWKSALGGHYRIGKDLREIRESLEHVAPSCELAEELLKHLPPLVRVDN